jgi:hypothetical protein
LLSCVNAWCTPRKPAVRCVTAFSAGGEEHHAEVEMEGKMSDRPEELRRENEELRRTNEELRGEMLELLRANEDLRRETVELLRAIQERGSDPEDD